MGGSRSAGRRRGEELAEETRVLTGAEDELGLRWRGPDVMRGGPASSPLSSPLSCLLGEEATMGKLQPGPEVM